VADSGQRRGTAARVRQGGPRPDATAAWRRSRAPATTRPRSPRWRTASAPTPDRRPGSADAGRDLGLHLCL